MGVLLLLSVKGTPGDFPLPGNFPITEPLGLELVVVGPVSRPCHSLESPVHVAPMAHSADGHHLLGIIDGIEDPVITYPHPQPALSVLDTFGSTRVGIFSERVKASLDTYEDVPR